MTDRQDWRTIVTALDLKPHPEGGYYAETWRDTPPDGGRGVVTQIYYLLPAGEISAWHRVTDATEIWHHYDGAALRLTLSEDGRTSTAHILGPDVLAGQHPHVVVPPGCWQTAASLGAWTLVGCTVAPGFEFSSFEMAPTGWAPPDIP